MEPTNELGTFSLLPYRQENLNQKSLQCDSLLIHTYI